MTTSLGQAFESEAPVGGLNWTFVLMGVADGTLLPFIPLYLFERGLNAFLIGAVLAGAASASLVAGLAWAYLADRRLRPERMIVLASGAAAVAVLLVALGNSGGAVAVAIIALSIARSPFMLLDPIALRRLRHSSRTDYARIRLRMSAGFTASAVLSGALFQAATLRLMPLVYAPLVALFGLWARHALKPGDQAPAPEKDSGGVARLHLPKVPLALIGFLVSCLLLGASLASTQNFLILRINYLGGGALLVGAAAAFQALTEIPTMAYTHVLRKRFSNRALFAIGCGIYVAVFLAWAFVSNALTAALLKLVIGVAFALTYVAAVVITDELSPAHLRATGQALVKAALFGLSPILGALGGGFIYGAFGSRAMFLAAIGVVGAAGLIAMIVVPARHAAVRMDRQEIAVPVAPEAIP
jgi:PPP family 3-phenylpropionic acid transporter